MGKRSIGRTTHARIKGYLEVFIEHLVKEYKERPVPTLASAAEYLSKSSPKGQLKPFHAAIIPQELLRISAFERGFSTALGTTFEECARLIALEHHSEAQRSHAMTGNISLAAINEIEHQVAAFESAAKSKGQRPPFAQMAQSVLNARREDDMEPRTVRADLYILAKDGTQYFFEMKSPQPNKGQGLEVTQRILRIHLLLGQPRPGVQAYFAMAYNPYGPTRADYKWSIARSYMPFDEVVLIGHEFWDIVGGPTAYEELLEIYQRVGREKSKRMLDALAFGF